MEVYLRYQTSTAVSALSITYGGRRMGVGVISTYPKNDKESRYYDNRKLLSTVVSKITEDRFLALRPNLCDVA